MSKDDILSHILEQADEPTEITADDLRQPVCTWCGEELENDSTTIVWDVPEHGNESVVYRHRYCSKECRENDENAIVSGDTMHPYGQPQRLDTDDFDGSIDDREQSSQTESQGGEYRVSE